MITECVIGFQQNLGVIARLWGEEAARTIANGTEYEWNRDPDNDPFIEFLDGASTGSQ